MPNQRAGISKKPVVFISYLSEEKDAALALKELLDKHLSDAVDTFVSNVSIGAGESWLNSLFRNLKSSVAQIVLCSPAASERHWIHFEAGAGWMRGIPVMPVYFAGMTERNLPDTFKHLQAVNASDPIEVTKLIRKVAESVGAKVKKIDCDGFIASMQEINLRCMRGPAFPKFFDTSADIQAELPHLIRATTSSILLCGIHFNISLANRMLDYLNALESGVSLTFCCVRADSPAVEHLAHFSGEDAAVLQNECQLTYTYYDKLKRAHAKQTETGRKAPGALCLRFAQNPPASRAYIFDHTTRNGKLIYVPYLHLRDSTQCPTVLMHAHHSIYQAFLESGLHQVAASDIYYQSASR